MTNLANHLKENQIKQRDFANNLGISKSHMSGIVSGAKRPDLKLAFKIERLTGGKVPAKSFDSPEDGDADSPLHPPHSEQSVSEIAPATEVTTAAR
jgi:transcriptional regulator with XRE-family HTH domain